MKLEPCLMQCEMLCEKRQLPLTLVMQEAMSGPAIQHPDVAGTFGLWLSSMRRSGLRLISSGLFHKVFFYTQRTLLTAVLLHCLQIQLRLMNTSYVSTLVCMLEALERTLFCHMQAQCGVSYTFLGVLELSRQKIGILRSIY